MGKQDKVRSGESFFCLEFIKYSINSTNGSKDWNDRKKPLAFCSTKQLTMALLFLSGLLIEEPLNYVGLGKNVRGHSCSLKTDVGRHY